MSRRILLASLTLVFVFVIGCPPGTGGLLILDFSPKTGPVGTTVTITGTNFSATAADNLVTIGGVAATVDSATTTEIVATVGAGAVTGRVTVEVAGDTATSAEDFVVASPPTIASFTPMVGFQGTRVKIAGTGFSLNRLDNNVKIGNVSAIVIAADATELEAIVGFGATDGPVEVAAVGGATTSSDDFKLLEWPAAGSGDDGPPIFYAGAGSGSSGDLPSTGTLEVLVVPAYPTDRVPASLANARQDIEDAWDNVETFYDQASYGALNVNVTVANWAPLSGNFNDYYSASHANIDPAALDRFTAECADDAEDQGEDMDDFDAMACYLWTNGVFLRAWGGWSKSNFSYSGNGLNINISVGHAVNLMALGELADWGRCAHELGHNLVHAGAVLGEDVYTSDLVDPGNATAHRFEMMGSHDSRPLFSGGYMHQLGWFDGANIVELNWDRNPFSAQYDIASHRLTEDTDASRYHLVRIKVAEGLYYFIETRQRPSGGGTQSFDANIPLGAAANNGGVIVTKVITDEVNNNQEMRFVSLLHDERVLIPGDVATDPARALEISVVSEQVVSGRLISRVRVEWAQDIAPDPNGDFDLRIEPWGAGYETVDIWIDRQPWGTYDHTDGSGNPTGNGDKPQVSAINHFWGRVHCDGSVNASNVRLTYYSISPPGVGDNGTWTPLKTVDIASVTAGDDEEKYINWTPVVDQHTCLQLIAEHQLGEVTFGNNKAQENVFEFEAAASSPPDPVLIPLAVRNPKDEPSIILVRMVGVPDGWIVQLPHHWVYLDALGEKRMEAVAIATFDIREKEQGEFRALNMLIDGKVPRQYTEKVEGVDPGSRMLPIGGINAMVTPKHRGEVELQEDPEFSKEPDTVGLRGTVTPAHADQPVEVVLTDPMDRVRVVTASTNASGQFTARFDLTHAPSNDPIEGKPGEDEEPVPGEYKARAYIVSAPLVAQAESSEVIIRKE